MFIIESKHDGILKFSFTKQKNYDIMQIKFNYKYIVSERGG